LSQNLIFDGILHQGFITEITPLLFQA